MIAFCLWIILLLLIVKFFAMNTIYKFDKLIFGRLKQRYKRFLADIDSPELSETTTVHCPNTGSMLTLIPPYNTNPECILSLANNLSRKYPHTLEYIKLDRAWVGIHSGITMIGNILQIK